MTNARSAVDAALAMLAALAWGFAVFAFGARWFSPLGAGLVALAIVLSGSAGVLSMHLRDRRLTALVKGACPACDSPIAAEHRHRRWEPVRAAWESPSTNWECERCGYSHSEAWACPNCPQA